MYLSNTCSAVVHLATLVHSRLDISGSKILHSCDFTLEGLIVFGEGRQIAPAEPTAQLLQDGIDSCQTTLIKRREDKKDLCQLAI